MKTNIKSRYLLFAFVLSHTIVASVAFYVAMNTILHRFSLYAMMFVYPIFCIKHMYICEYLHITYGHLRRRFMPVEGRRSNLQLVFILTYDIIYILFHSGIIVSLLCRFCWCGWDCLICVVLVCHMIVHFVLNCLVCRFDYMTCRFVLTVSELNKLDPYTKVR